MKHIPWPLRFLVICKFTEEKLSAWHLSTKTYKNDLSKDAFENGSEKSARGNCRLKNTGVGWGWWWCAFEG